MYLQITCSKYRAPQCDDKEMDAVILYSVLGHESHNRIEVIYVRKKMLMDTEYMDDGDFEDASHVDSRRGERVHSEVQCENQNMGERRDGEDMNENRVGL